MRKIKKPVLERLHKAVFGFDADIQVMGWSWRYWYYVDPEVSPEGDYRAVTDGIFCFQRRYAV
jgi:hypothetical protein